MKEDILFQKLVKITNENEEKNWCPIFTCGMICNTANQGNWLDVESEYCAEILQDEVDLIEFLIKSHIKVEDLWKAVEEIEEFLANGEEEETESDDVSELSNKCGE